MEGISTYFLRTSEHVYLLNTRVDQNAPADLEVHPAYYEYLKNTDTEIQFKSAFHVQPLSLAVDSGIFQAREEESRLLDTGLQISFAKSNFPSVHLAEIFYRMCRRNAAKHASYAGVLYFDQYGIVFYFEQQKLILANGFDIRNSEELLYYLIASPVMEKQQTEETRFEVLAAFTEMPGISEIFSRHLQNTGNFDLELPMESGDEHDFIGYLLNYTAHCE